MRLGRLRSQSRVTTRPCRPSAGIPPHSSGVACANKGSCACLQVLHEPEAEPPAKKFKQAAAQPKRKAPAKENAKPAAGTKRMEVEHKVGTCITAIPRLRCHVVKILLGAAAAANGLV